MKTRERLLFMALGGLLVLAGMIVGQFMFSTAQAQAGAQDATFKTVRCEELIVGNSKIPKAVVVNANYSGGALTTYNETSQPLIEMQGSTIRLKGNRYAEVSEVIVGSPLPNGGIGVSIRERFVPRSLYPPATIDMYSKAGTGHIKMSNTIGKNILSIGASTGFLMKNPKGQEIVSLWQTESGGGTITIYNQHGVEVTSIQANKDKDGMILLKDRYGDLGWARTGKQ